MIHGGSGTERGEFIMRECVAIGWRQRMREEEINSLKVVGSLQAAVGKGARDGSRQVAKKQETADGKGASCSRQVAKKQETAHGRRQRSMTRQAAKEQERRGLQV